MKLGSHVSIEGGVSRAVLNANALGATCFAMWLKNSRNWTSKPYEKEEIERFRSRCKEYNYNPASDILPHASYLINLGNPDMAKRPQHRSAFLDELQRCEQLGIGLYNIHPGSSLGQSKEVAIETIAEAINWAHGETSFVKVVLENMTGDKSRIVGTELSDLAQIIELVQNKDRIGVCVDTCHTLAAGWDLREEKGFSNFWEEFDSVVGMNYLSAIHVNDSCWPKDSLRDQHASVCTGFCGPEMFRLLVNTPALADVPKILETPTHEKDLAVLKSLIGKSKAEAEKSAAPLVEAGRLMRESSMVKIENKAKKQATKKSAAKGTGKRKAEPLEGLRVVVDKRAKN